MATKLAQFPDGTWLYSGDQVCFKEHPNQGGVVLGLVTRDESEGERIKIQWLSDGHVTTIAVSRIHLLQLSY